MELLNSKKAGLLQLAGWFFWGSRKYSSPWRFLFLSFCHCRLYALITDSLTFHRPSWNLSAFCCFLAHAWEELCTGSLFCPRPRAKPSWKYPRSSRGSKCVGLQRKKKCVWRQSCRWELYGDLNIVSLIKMTSVYSVQSHFYSCTFQLHFIHAP